MIYAVCSVAILALAAIVLATGWWRLALAAFKISPDEMTVARLGLLVPDEHEQRVNTVLRSFAGGFNATIAAPSASAWERYCESLSTLGRPFAHEGAAMGYTPRRLFGYDPADFEERLVHRHPGFRYLHYVGLGFWSGMRHHSPQRLARIVENLDPLYRYLCYDGFGFKHAFFDYPKDPASLRKLNSLDGYARNAAYQGVGRAFFFYFMRDPEVLIEHIERLGVYAIDAAGGVGLASVFVFPDRLEVARELAGRLPGRWHEDVHLGMCFGLKARSINDPRQFKQDVARLTPDVQAAVRAAIDECDRVEAHLRAERAPNAYQRWRALVSQWMASQIEYPLASARPSESGRAARQRQTTGGVAADERV